MLVTLRSAVISTGASGWVSVGAATAVVAVRATMMARRALIYILRDGDEGVATGSLLPKSLAFYRQLSFPGEQLVTQLDQHCHNESVGLHSCAAAKPIATVGEQHQGFPVKVVLKLLESPNHEPLLLIQSLTSK